MAYPLNQKLNQKGVQNQKQQQLIMLLPEMQRAMDLLQAPVMELGEQIELELEQNPVLEYFEEVAGEMGVKKDEGVKELDLSDQDYSVLKDLDESFEDFFSQDQITEKITEEDKKKRSFKESLIVEERTLYQHLMEQAQETFETEKERRVASHLIGSLDLSGFFKGDFKEAALLTDSTPDFVERVLKEVQKFDPPGIAARSLQESLLTQLRYQDKENTIGYRLIRDYFDDFIHHRLPLIQKKSRLSHKQIQKAIDQDITHLDLHPGTLFNTEDVGPMVPDASLLEEDGVLTVTINDDSVPPLRFNRTYLQLLRQESSSEETKEYITKKLNSAKLLIKNIEQRHQTLTRILEAIAKHQRAFLVRPEGQLKPMTMTALAEELGLHESTVARAVSRKVVHTPRGLLMLRSFFTTALTTQDGGEVSNATIKEEILKIIDKEDKKKPFSDVQLAEILKKEGYIVARRTVAKYRALLSIGSSTQRRKYS